MLPLCKFKFTRELDTANDFDGYIPCSVKIMPINQQIKPGNFYQKILPVICNFFDGRLFFILIFILFFGVTSFLRSLKLQMGLYSTNSLQNSSNIIKIINNNNQPLEIKSKAYKIMIYNLKFHLASAQKLITFTKKLIKAFSILISC